MNSCKYRELDALIADKVMGWIDVHREGDWGYLGRPFGAFRDFRIPNYSTEITEAWEIVEKLRPHFLIRIENSGSLWIIDFGCSDPITRIGAVSAPHAICLAALQAVGYKGV